MPEYKLPDVGEGLTEAEIVTWKVKVGDVIAINDIVVEIETAKSLVELPSPYAGTVTALLVAEGETVDVGTPIIAIGDAAVRRRPRRLPPHPQAPAEIDLSNPAASGGGEGESLVGRNKAERDSLRRPRRASSPAAAAAEQSTHDQLQASFTPGELETPPVVEADEPAVPAHAPESPAASNGDVRTLAKPPVRKLAKDLGVDITSLVGSGEGGVVTREDVQAASGSPVSRRALARLPRPAGACERETARAHQGRAQDDGAGDGRLGLHRSPRHRVGHRRRHPHDGVRRAAQGPARVPRRQGLAAAGAGAGRACWPRGVRPRSTPGGTSRAQEVVFKSYVNLGIAAATARGLVVPNVKDAQDLSLLDLAAALNGLTATAREGKTQPADMSGGTFTITNVGVFGIDAGTPIINPGESAILAFGAVRKKPWVASGPAGDEIVVRQVTTLALSFDHRHVDGEKGSRFLADVAAIMEDPAAALLF